MCESLSAAAKFCPFLGYWWLSVWASNEITLQCQHRDLKNLSHPGRFSVQSLISWLQRLFLCPKMTYLSLTTKEPVRISGISSDAVFNNSLIVICKSRYETHTSQHKEHFEGWSRFRPFKMNNNFSAKVICRGDKIFSTACKPFLLLSGLLCIKICNCY